MRGRKEQSLMMPADPIRRSRSASASIVEQSRAIAKARNDLALRQELDARISGKHRVRQRTSQNDPLDSADDGALGSQMLVREAHQVLLRYLPAVALPDELWEVRAMLDTHMFGRNNRVSRDDVVRLARQIDRMADL
jgi:hypothetical protein